MGEEEKRYKQYTSKLINSLENSLVEIVRHHARTDERKNLLLWNNTDTQQMKLE